MAIKPTSKLRFVIPDSHGSAMCPKAADAIVADVKRYQPDEFVWLGDHVDGNGPWSAHSLTAREELEYSYDEDWRAHDRFLTRIEDAAPKAKHDILEGNHEWHIERSAINDQRLRNKLDVDAIIQAFAPHRLLRLKERGHKFYRFKERYQGMRFMNTIVKGKCAFTHGLFSGMNAAKQHLDAFKMNCAFGHVHRACHYYDTTARDEQIAAFCDGWIGKPPAYTHALKWTTGYGVQVETKGGYFHHIHVPIINGRSLLQETLEAFGGL